MTDREHAEAKAKILLHDYDKGLGAWPEVANALMDFRREALEEAAKIVSAARFGEIDGDLRSISHAIRALASRGTGGW